MPRGKKIYAPAEELELVNSKIAAAEDEIKQLKSRRKELEKAIEETALRDLYDTIIKSGKTVVEVMELIKPED